MQDFEPDEVFVLHFSGIWLSFLEVLDVSGSVGASFPPEEQGQGKKLHGDKLSPVFALR